MADVDQLAQFLREAVALLRGYGEDYWADALASDLPSVESGAEDGLQRLLARFGGMGSFNDLFLDVRNGHRVVQTELGPVNQRLSSLRTAIWIEAKALESGRR